MPIAYEPFAAQWRDDPFPVYRRLRDESPAYRAPESGVYCISRYDDVATVLKNPDLFSSSAMVKMLMKQGRDEPPPMSWAIARFVVRYWLRTRQNAFRLMTARNLIGADPPEHSALRNTVSRGFTPRRIAMLEPRIRQIVAHQLARLDDGSDFDVIRDLAIPLPVTIIAEMIGVEPDRASDFKRWSDTIIEVAAGPARDDPFQSRIMDAVLELNAYLVRVIRERRREPADDLISAILAEEPGGTRLSDLDVVQFVQLLLVAGNETTTNLIGNAVHALLDHPAELERVVRDPSLIPSAVEEVLRFDSPIQMLFRTATRDLEIAGMQIPRGATVVPLLGSANRDERRFDDPDRFDVTRDDRGHVAFGFGQHFCLGASLARREATAALEGLAPLLPRLERCGRDRELIDSYLVRGPIRLELRRAA